LPKRKIPLKARAQVAAAVAARYAQGIPWMVMEAEFDLTARTLCILLREAGGEPNRGFGRNTKSPIPIVDAAAAYNDGASIRQVAKRLRRSYGSVHAALSACPDVELRPPGPKRSRPCTRVKDATGRAETNAVSRLAAPARAACATRILSADNGDRDRVAPGRVLHEPADIGSNGSRGHQVRRSTGIARSRRMAS